MAIIGSNWGERPTFGGLPFNVPSALSNSAAIQAGDLILLAMETSDGNPSSADFTRLYLTSNAADAFFVRTATGSEAAGWTFTSDGAVNESWSFVVVRGFAIEGTPGGTGLFDGSWASASQTSIAATLALLLRTNHANVSGATLSAPTGMTLDVASAVTNQDPTVIQSDVWHQTITPGASVSYSGTYATNAGTYGTLLVLLAPSGGGGGGGSSGGPLLTQQRAPGFPPNAPIPGIPLLGRGLLVPANPKPSVALPVSSFRAQQRAKGFPPRAPLPGIALLGVGILAVTTAPMAANNATGAAAVSSFAATAAGAVTFDAPGSAALSSFAASGSGSVPVPPLPTTMAQPGPRMLGFPGALVSPPGPLLGTASLIVDPALSGSITSIGSAALSSFAATATGSVSFTGSGSTAMSSFAASGTLAEAFAATGSAALSPFGSSGSGAEAFASSGSAAASPFASSGSGAETFDAPGSAAVASFAITATGAIASLLSPSFTAQPQPRLFGFPGRIGRPAGLLNVGLLASPQPPIPNTANVAVSPFAVTASGLVTFTGSSAGALSSFAASASATEAFAGTAAAATQSFAASGSASETFASTASAACSSFASAASGSESFAGTGAAACSPFGAAGNGAQGTVFTSTGAAALASFAPSGAGAETFAITGSAALGSFALSASGAELFTGTAAAACSSFVATGAGIFSGPITGSGSAALASFGAAAACSELFAFSGSSSCSPFAAHGQQAPAFARAPLIRNWPIGNIPSRTWPRF